MQVSLANSYNSTAVQNVVMHLLNFKLWIIRVFIAFLRNYCAETNSSVPIKTLARAMADGIITHKEFEDATDTRNIPGFREIYNKIKLFYYSDFGSTSFDDLNNYNHASGEPLKFIRFSYRLLKECSHHDGWQTKTWSLLPEASHEIVHARITGPKAMYGLFQIAHRKNITANRRIYHIPPELYQGDHLLYFFQFNHLYNDFLFKQELWENMFDISRVQKQRVMDHATSHGLQADDPKQCRFAFSISTDGHMASLLFEKRKTFWLPQNKKDLQMQRRNVDFTNKDNGIYPLYKLPTGITMEDRIIGIDPGVRDVICAVDRTEDLLSNKEQIQAGSFRISNAAYKERSGMKWQYATELRNRQNANMQESYDRLRSRNVFSAEGLTTYLVSLSGQNQRIHNYNESFPTQRNQRLYVCK